MLPDRTARIAVLLSVGQHPLTASPRRADQDARALELALQLPGVEVLPVHAGELNVQNEAALRSYLGMGAAALKLLPAVEGDDVLPLLQQGLRDLQPDLVLCGKRAERGESSGLIPYLLAQSLGWPVISGLVEIERLEADHATVLQALPRGQRRRLRVTLPAVLAMDDAAPAARQSAFGPARRGLLQLEQMAVAPDQDDQNKLSALNWQFQPARKRPKRLKIIKATSARDRFKAAAAKAEASGGQVLQGLAPDAAAEAILKMLREEGVMNSTHGD